MTGYNLPDGVTQDALDRYLEGDGPPQADIRRASMHAAPEDHPAIPDDAPSPEDPEVADLNDMDQAEEDDAPESVIECGNPPRMGDN